MNILYMVFGDNLGYHKEAYLSIRSFQRQMAEGDRIYMLTSQPEYYQRAGINLLEIDEQTVARWKGPHQFVFRAKIMAMRHLATLFPDEHLLYLDTDTFLYGRLDDLRQRLDNGQALMHLREGHPSQMKASSLRMWKQVEGKVYGGIKIGAEHDMWNAGVVGLPHERMAAIIDTALAVCDGMLDDGVQTHVTEQYAQSVALAEGATLAAASDHIGHYWSNKPAWEELSTELMLKAYMRNESLQEELACIDDALFRQLPVYAHHSSTAAKLHRLVDKWFPDKREERIP